MKKAVYCDIHGVILDFVTGVERFFRVSLANNGTHVADQLKSPHGYFWSRVDFPEFWAELPPLAPGLQLLRVMRDICAAQVTEGLPMGVPVYLLSRPQEHAPRGMEGTAEAVRHLIPFEQLIFTHRKEACAPGFLIDDEPANVVAWQKAGGVGYVWPSRSNNFCLAGQPTDPSYWSATLTLAAREATHLLEAYLKS